MIDTAKFLTVGMVTDDQTPIDPSLAGGSAFLTTCFKLELFRVVAEIAPGYSKDPSLGELWRDLPPENGKYTFEIATELPFFLPNLEGRPEYLIAVANQQLFVCNRMVRAFASVGYPTDSGLSYFLAHRLGLPDLAKHKLCEAGIHPVPLRSFVSLRLAVPGERAEPVIESGFLSWRKELLNALSMLIIAMRETAPEKLRNVLPHSSIGGFPVFWLAAIGAEGKPACEHFAGDVGTSSPKPMENLAADEVTRLKERLSTAVPCNWRQALGLAEAFHFYGYYELAIIQVSVACEIVLASLLKGHLTAKGVSNSTVKEHFKDITFSQLLNILLPCLADFSSLRHKDRVLGDINWVRKRRNEIVHQGPSLEPLTGSRVGAVLASATELIDFLQGQMRAEGQ